MVPKLWLVTRSTMADCLRHPATYLRAAFALGKYTFGFAAATATRRPIFELSAAAAECDMPTKAH
jgi:hypothetical protein